MSLQVGQGGARGSQHGLPHTTKAIILVVSDFKPYIAITRNLHKQQCGSGILHSGGQGPRQRGTPEITV